MLLLAFAGTLLAGLAIREWRAGFPDAAERLERFDREEARPLVTPALRPEPRAEPRAGAGKLAAPARGASATPREGAGAAAAGAGPAEARPLDLNRASTGDLTRLPGVGVALAERILAERERRGRFDSPEALRSVYGMGPRKLAAIRELVTVEPPATP
jgi:competence ComEA-like helix-hairpin-helix protein